MDKKTPNAYQRKKQPEQVREQLLSSAMDIIISKGMVNLTLDAVAKKAGVSKGGLLHHFPNKQALMTSVFENLLNEFDAHTEQTMAKDDNSHGRYSRAYLAVNSTLYHPRSSHLMAMLTLAMSTDEQLRQQWLNWHEKHIKEHKGNDDNLNCTIVRLAADGLWLSALTQTPKITPKRYKELIQKLNEISQQED